MTPIEAYIANTPQAYQSQLIALQQTIATVLPEAQEQSTRCRPSIGTKTSSILLYSNKQ